MVDLTGEVCKVLQTYIEEMGKDGVHIFFPNKYKDLKWGGDVRLTFGDTPYLIITGAYGQNYCVKIIE